MEKKLLDRAKMIKRSRAYIKAYEDLDFLRSDELRHIRVELELLKPEILLRKHNVNGTVVVFGSARIFSPEGAQKRVREIELIIRKNPKDASLKEKLESAKDLLKSSKFYEEARKFGRIISREKINGHKLIVVTGGGPGIMEAANRGAYEAGEKTIGLNITLPMEQYPNPYISPEFAFRFHYFAIRKMHFVMRARALVVFPGGFGTYDELFEVLTLVQTSKKRHLPIILFGSDYWKDVINFENIAKWGYISYEDLDLFKFADKAEDAVKIIKDFYKNPAIWKKQKEKA
ncbi:MAG: TIGR00730 family Rossman fold protein [Elusimicrobia bacterium CG08_land_8_20_14_0_20_51_18]|nr:MAG: TIGR00730 family Rossman fold protein [Elusimicrobia bacterium CG08_land_8_20_14_0_20_51_18]